MIAAAGAQPRPVLLADLNSDPAPLTESSRPRHGVRVGDVVYFVADSAEYGAEIWRTDGTPEGTSILNDIVPGPTGSIPALLTSFGELLSFVTFDGALWFSDGTSAGTQPFQHIQTLRPGARVAQPIAVADEIYFVLTTSSSERELWRTNATTAGTHLVKTLGDVAPSQLTSFSGSVAFVVSRPGELSKELWVSDGSEANTGAIRIFPGRIGIAELTDVGGTLFFRVTRDGNHETLWKSDGTSEGTSEVGPVGPGARSFTAYGNTLYFLAGSTDLLRSDGSAEGTQPLLEDGFRQVGNDLVVLDHRLYFAAKSADHVHGLWRTDGSTAGTELVKLLHNIPTELIVAGRYLYFPTGFTPDIELARSDGTQRGTRRVSEINTTLDERGRKVGSYPRQMVALGEAIVFSADDGAHGSEPWFSDGSDAGTTLLANIAADLPRTGTSSFGPSLEWNGSLFFVHAGNELWITDGTQNGTRLVASPGTVESPLFRFGDRVLFTVETPPLGEELWISDGSAAGTMLVKDIAPGLPGSAPLLSEVQIGGSVLFSATGAVGGRELWRSDGTSAGTLLVKDINPGRPLFYRSSNPRDFISLGRFALFSAETIQQGREPWVSDGTEAGTKILRDLNPSGDSNPVMMGVRDDVAIFSADDGVHGLEVWRSDGTTLGTRLLLDAADGPGGSFPRFAGTVGSRLLFSAFDGEGVPLWATDGTPSGTRKLSQSASVDSVHPTIRFAGDTALIAMATSGSGDELWRTDGTPAGTSLVKDIAPGEDPSRPDLLASVGSEVFLIADDGVHGRELWVSDGTEIGTRMVADLTPGPFGSDFKNAIGVGGRLYFEYAGQLWSSDGTSAGTTPVPAPGTSNTLDPSLTLAAIDGALLFLAENELFGRELWLLAASCGDGSVGTGESCDDGNLADDDGCDSNCTPTGCGNGILTSGETCDDGNTKADDCCTDTCEPAAAGSACSTGPGPLSGCEERRCNAQGRCETTAATAGVVCRAAQRQCDTAEICNGNDRFCGPDWSVPDGAECDDRFSCNGADQCVAGRCEPRDEIPPLSTDCLAADRSVLVMRDRSNDAQDATVWKWKGDGLEGPQDFGDPVTSTDYAWCLYAGTSHAVIAELSIPAGEKWRPMAERGFFYADREGEADGLSRAQLIYRDSGRSRISLRARGDNVVEAEQSSLPLAPWDFPVLAHFVDQEHGLCFEAIYEQEDLLVNERTRLKLSDR